MLELLSNASSISGMLESESSVCPDLSTAVSGPSSAAMSPSTYRISTAKEKLQSNFKNMSEIYQNVLIVKVLVNISSMICNPECMPITRQDSFVVKTPTKALSVSMSVKYTQLFLTNSLLISLLYIY